MEDVRPKFNEIYMRLAIDLAGRSTCKRLAVGAVITSTDFRYVYGVGYNGVASGLYNGCLSKEPGKCGCLHAEENAVINCKESRNTDKFVICTHFPCVMCMQRLFNMGGVRRIYWAKGYRSMSDSVKLVTEMQKSYDYTGAVANFRPDLIEMPDFTDLVATSQ
jgi:dCMP deaminase